MEVGIYTRTRSRSPVVRDLLAGSAASDPGRWRAYQFVFQCGGQKGGRLLVKGNN
jgi:hypothetical protein